MAGSWQSGDSHEDVWAGLPQSNLYKQKKLTGWRDSADDADEPGVVRRATCLTPERLDELHGFVAAARCSVDTVLLGVYHVVLQWYLDDVESLIGWCLRSFEPASPSHRVGPVATVSPSHVYAEDDDLIEAVLVDIERQGQSARRLDIDLSSASFLDNRRAPVFFYASVAGTDSRDASAADALAAPFEERRVIVAVDAHADRTELAVSMPSAVSRTTGIEDFERRYDCALSSLLSGRCAHIGELRASLGAASDTPYRQLDEMQSKVIQLWAKVLAVPETSLSEASNYFEVGGTSLNAFKLMNRVRVEFGRDISIWEINESPTVQGFSRALLQP